MRLNQYDLMEQVKRHLKDLQSKGITELSVEARPVVPLQETNPEQTLQKIRQEIGDCTRCKLCQARTHIVFGTGNPQAELMFIGEGPGRDEDLQGEPFVGAAGQLLTKMVEAMGLKRKEVYICNVVMCRPPENRLPGPDEVATCSPFLFQQIAVIRPKVIVTLGNLAAQTLLKTEQGITKLRGKFYELNGIPVMPTFHPAYLLRNAAMKRPCWEDLKKVVQLLGKRQKP